MRVWTLWIIPCISNAPPAMHMIVKSLLMSFLTSNSRKHSFEDRGYNVAKIFVCIVDQEARHDVSSKENRVYLRKYDWWLCKEHHFVECLFNKLQHFRRIATRYDKFAESFFAFIAILLNIVPIYWSFQNDPRTPCNRSSHVLCLGV